MKKQDFLKELRKLEAEALRKRIGELGEELMKLRWRRSMGQLEQMTAMKQLRQQIAQAKTVLQEKLNTQAAGQA